MKTFTVRISQISIHNLAQAQRLAGFPFFIFWYLVGFHAEFVSVGLGNVSLALISGQNCVSFTVPF